jgi:hypothetical protein
MAVSEAAEKLIKNTPSLLFVIRCSELCFRIAPQKREIHSASRDRPLQIRVVRRHFRQDLVEILQPWFRVEGG